MRKIYKAFFISDLLAPLLKRISVLCLLVFGIVISAISQSITVTNVTTTPVCAGSSVTITFSVTNGSGASNYFTNGTNYQVFLSDANGNNFNASGAAFSNAGPYTTGDAVTTSNLTASFTIPAGTPSGSLYQVAIGAASPSVTVPSANATPGSAFTINAQVTPSVYITTDAPSNTICAGTTVTFTANPANGGTPVYQWRKNGLNISGATSSSYSTSTILSTDVYTISMTSSLPCTISNPVVSSGVSITVNPNPTAIAGSALAAICQGGTSAAMGGSVGGSATGGTWTGGAGTWTNANNPATATYTAGASESGNITLTLTTSGGSCGTTSVTKTITVNTNPTVNAGTALAAICQGGTSAAMGGSVGGSATGGTWTGGAGTWTNANNPATATYTAGASESGNITLTLTTSGGSCGTTSVTKTITVNTNPTVNAGSALAAICQGGTSAAMGGSVGGSATGGTWTGGAGTWTNANNPATATYTAGASESGNITLTLTTSGGSCGTTSVTKTITVNTNPTVNAGTALAAICQGGTSAAMGGSVGGSATGGTWTGGAGTWTNANNPATATYTAGASESGNITLTLTTSGGSCGTTSVTKTITVNTNPTVNAGSALAAICQGGTSTALGGSVGGSATGGIWSDGGIGGAFNPGATTLNSTWTPPAAYNGTAILKLTTTGGSCSSVFATKTIVVNPTLVPSVSLIASSTSICSSAGTSVTFTATPTNGGSTPVYTFKNGATTLQTGSSNTYTTTSLPSGASITASLTSNATCASPTTVTSTAIAMTVYTGAPAKPGSITTNAPSSICPVATGYTFSVPAVANATSYVWNFPDAGWIITSGAGTNSIVVTVSGSAVNGNGLAVTVQAQNACGISTASTAVTFKVNKFAAVSAGSNQSVCAGGSINIAGTLLGNASTGAWTAPSGSFTNVNLNNASATYKPSVLSGTVTLTLTPNTPGGDCSGGVTTDQMIVTVNPLPAASGAISGTATVCQGQNSVTYTVPSIANATSYVWAYSGTGATITGSANSVTISFSNTATSGNLTVYGTNSCGNGTISGNYAVTVNPLPAASGAISGTATVCQGQNSVTYTVPSIANATSYVWAYSGTGATITGSANSVTISFSNTATSGNLTVYGTNSCGNGTISGNYAVTVNPLPAASGAISGTATVCQGQNSVTYTVPSIANATSYVWAYSGTGATITGSANSVTISFSNTATSGNLTVYGTNSCGNGTISGNYAVTVNPLPAASGAISGTATVCQGQNSVTYTVPSIANATSYVWAYSGTGATITGSANSVTISFSNTATSGNLTVYGTNSCGNGTISGNYAVTVNPLPAASGAISGTATVCQGQNSVTYTVPSIANATSYVWAYSGTGATITGSANSVTISFSNTATSGNLTVYGTNSCGNGTISGNYAVTVNQPPAITTQPTPQTVCSSFPVSFSVSATGTGLTYQWYKSSGAITNGGTVSGATSATLTISQAALADQDNYYVVVSGASPCLSNPSSTVSLTVNQSIAINTQPVAQTSCLGGSATFTVAASGNISDYQWRKNGTPIAGATNATLTLTNLATTDAGNYDVIISGTDNTCSQAISKAAPLVVNMPPAITAQPSSAMQSACLNGTATALSVTATGAGLTYQWYSNTTSSNSGGTLLAGATLSTYTPSAATAGTLYYYVIVSGTCTPPATSAVSGAVTINTAPAITVQPSTATQSVCLNGSTTALSVTATGAGVTYQWYSNSANSNSGGTLLAGATLSTYTPSAATAGTLYYYVIVSGTCTPPATSAVSGAVTINAAPAITVQPSTATQSVCLNGSTTALSVTATGAGLTYQWYSNTTSSNSGGTLLAGATLSTYTPLTTTAGTLYYYAVVTGTCTPPATSAVSGAIIINKAPAVTASPSTTTQSVCLNGTATALSVTATGAGLTYQWYSNTTSSNSGGTLLAGATLSTYTPSAATAGTLYYYVIVSGTCTPPATSAVSGAIIINKAPAITASPSTTPQSVCLNGTATALSVTATGAGLTYQWYSNTTSSNTGGTLLAGATLSTYTPLTTTAGTLYYYAVVTGTCTPPATSAVSGAITINTAPAITVQPSTATQSVCLNGTATALSVTATGAGLTYQWYSNSANSNSGGTLISGATAATYTPLTITAGTLYYYVVVSGSCTPPATSAVSGAITVSPLPVAGTLSITAQSNAPNPGLLCATSNSATLTLSSPSGTVSWQQSTNGSTWTPASGSGNSLTVSNLAQTTIYRASVINGPCATPVYSNIVALQVIPALAPTNPLATPPIICLGQSSSLTADTGYPVTGIPSGSGDFQNANPAGWLADGCGNCLNASGDNGSPTPWVESNGNNYMGYQSPQPKFAITHGTFNSILQTPVFSLIAQPTASLTFIQSYNFSATDTGKIEISTDGGTTYSALIPPYIGPSVFGGPTNFPTVTLDLSAYVGLSNLRIRFNFRGHSGNGVWALDGLSTPGASLPISYMWSGTILSSTTGVPVVATPTSTGTSTYTLQSNVGGCPGGSVNVTVLVNPLPTLTGVAAAPVCTGANGTINLSGLLPNTTSSITYNIGGGAPVNVTGIVSNASGNGSFTVPLTSANNGQKLTITSITGSNSNGISCSASPTVSTTLTVNPLPTATIAGTVAICQSGTAPNITLTGAAGTAPYTFTYSINGVTQSTITSSGNSATVAAPTGTAGTFTYALISVKDASTTACVNAQTGNAIVTVNPQASLSAQPSNVVFCPEGIGASFSVTNQLVSPAFTYSWLVNDGVSGWQPVTGSAYTTATTSTATTATSTLNISNLTAGNTKDGYLYSVQVAGAGGSCPVPSASAKLTIHNIWHGYTNTDWNTGTNWSDGAVPTLTCDSVIILNVANKPVLSSGANGYANHLVIRPGATVTVTSNTLHIAAGIWDNNMALDATQGMIDLNGNIGLNGVGTRPAQTIAGKMFNTPYLNNAGRIKDLQISNPKGATVAAPTVSDTLNITGSLGFGNVNSVILNTGDNITLVSNASATARVRDLTNAGTNTANNFNGKVEVERYINTGTGAGQHGKAWEFLGTPTQGQSVLNSWMESGSFAATGYGTQITSPTGSGFDATSIYPSMKTYLPGGSTDPTATNWLGVTSTANMLYNPNGYMLFVRGDRSIPGPFTPPIPTRMRSKGTLLSYTQSVPVGIYTFGSVGNLYASALDMRVLMADRTGNVDEFFTLWYSPPYGTYGYGSYITYGLNPQTGNYESVPGGTVNNNVQSGEAFFVQTTLGGGNVVFNEHSKTSGSSNAVFTPVRLNSPQAQLRTNLYRFNPDGSTGLADGTLIQYNIAWSNKIDGMDARKFFNSNDNLTIRSGGKDLIIERRQPIFKNDTIFLRLNNVQVHRYRFEFLAQSLMAFGVKGFIVDSYLNTRTPLNMDGATVLDFNIETNAASYTPGRFYIVFNAPTVAVHPATITALKAHLVDGGISVEWNTSNEKDMQQYDVEKSLDGLSFSSVNTNAAKNTGTVAYNWLDTHVIAGYYYYRIRCVSLDGAVQYTTIAKVFIGDGKPSITVYPNPITNGIINLQLKNLPAGRYGMRLMNQLGQVIASKQIERAEGSSTETITWDYNLAHGLYRLEIIQPGGDVKQIKIMY